MATSAPASWPRPAFWLRRLSGTRALTAATERGNFPAMSTLAEIEAAADSLPAAQKQELLFYVAARLRAEGGVPAPPRQFTKEQMDGWIADDEADMEKFRRGA